MIWLLVVSHDSFRTYCSSSMIEIFLLPIFFLENLWFLCSTFFNNAICFDEEIMSESLLHDTWWSGEMCTWSKDPRILSHKPVHLARWPCERHYKDAFITNAIGRRARVFISISLASPIIEPPNQIAQIQPEHQDIFHLLLLGYSDLSFFFCLFEASRGLHRWMRFTEWIYKMLSLCFWDERDFFTQLLPTKKSWLNAAQVVCRCCCCTLASSHFPFHYLMLWPLTIKVPQEIRYLFSKCSILMYLICNMYICEPNVLMCFMLAVRGSYFLIIFRMQMVENVLYIHRFWVGLQMWLLWMCVCFVFLFFFISPDQRVRNWKHVLCTPCY